MDLLINCNGDVELKKIYELTNELTKVSKNSFNLYFKDTQSIKANSTLEIDLGITCILRGFNTNIILKSTALYKNEPYWIICNEYIGKTPLIAKNAPIFVEGDSEGETIKIVLYNHSGTEYKINKGMSLFKIINFTSKINKILVVN
jgi:hypothetical protein